MKTLSILSAIALVAAGGLTSYGQVVEPEVPGDQFSLEGALELFKKSASPEEFEKTLNSPESKVNNLDLNGDGYIDYIRVVDRNDGNVHAFILQAVVSESESQDVAVIELEKLANGKAVLQIVGDEDVYGVTTIIEPTSEVRTYAGTQTTRTVVNVWAWPSVQYVYGPRYSIWISPWGWQHRPVWWHTWRPVAYVHYYPIWRPYHRYYAPCYTRRVVYAHTLYRPYRKSSVVVRDRYHDTITRYRSSHRDDQRYGRTRGDNRSFVDNNRVERRSVDQRRHTDVDRNRPYATSREVRPATGDRSRERTAPTSAERRPSLVEKPQTPGRTAPDRVETQRRVAPSTVPDRSRATTNQRAVRPSSPQPGTANPVPRSSQVRRSPTSVQRNSNLQRSAAPGGKRGAVVQRHGSPAPTARPAAPARGRSGSPSVQQRSHDRSPASRSASGRRGRY